MTSRTKLPPATGHVCWLRSAPNGNSRLEITAGNVSHIYEVVRREEGGYNLLRVKDGDTVCYTITIHGRDVWECNCPDATNRPERKCSCKHVRGLRKALQSLPF